MEVVEKTFSNLIEENASSNPNGISFSTLESRLTYEELKKGTDYYANLLIEKGIKKGDHVAIWAFNGVNWICAFYSIIKTGAVAVLLNYSSPLEDLAELLRFTNCKAVFYGNNREIKNDENAAFHLAELSEIKKEMVFTIRSAQLNFNEMAKKQADYSKLEELKKNDDPHRTAVIIFTTGTTAMPKAVQLSQFGIINAAIGYAERFIHAIGNGICNSLPLFHSFGLGVCTAYFFYKKTVYLHGHLAPQKIIDIIDKYKITDMSSVSSVYIKLVEEREFNIKIVPNIRICLIGGGFSSSAQMIRLEGEFKFAKFVMAYGLTESSPFITVVSPDNSIEKRSHTVGYPISRIECKIWDKDKGFLPQGEKGEVVTRGYHLMNGYYNLPKEQQSIDDDGWLHTGDLGYLDEDGFLHLAGRIKDIIIKNGENISPIEIEKEINKNPNVKEVKVLGAPHPLTGESVECCLAPAKGKKIDIELIKADLKKKLGSFKVPSHFFIYESLPVNANGKLDQRGLKADMLKKLKSINLQESLKDGLPINKVQVITMPLAIKPVKQLFLAITDELNFSEKRISKISKLIDSILTEQPENGIGNVNEIFLEFKLMEKSLRIEISDNGDLFMQNNGTYRSFAADVLKLVDKFQIIKSEKERTVYALDFLYEKGFDIIDFCKNK